VLLLPVLLYALNRRAGAVGAEELDGDVATHFFYMQVCAGLGRGWWGSCVCVCIIACMYEIKRVCVSHLACNGDVPPQLHPQVPHRAGSGCMTVTSTV
jgi:hypothetical protein